MGLCSHDQTDDDRAGAAEGQVAGLMMGRQVTGRKVSSLDLLTAKAIHRDLSKATQL